MLPLANRRVLVTRAKGQASTLADQLSALGATPILIPTIELAPPPSYEVLDQALAQLATFDWLLFTSANAVDAFAKRASHLGIKPVPQSVAAIGPATAKAARMLGLDVQLIPPRYVAEALSEALLPYANGASMLLVRAAAARDLLPLTLAAAGARMTLADAYQTVIPPDSVKQLRRVLESGRLDAVTFTSASTAENLDALLQSAGLKLGPNMVLASIGPITSQAMRTLSFAPTIEALESTIPALIAALAAHFASCA